MTRDEPVGRLSDPASLEVELAKATPSGRRKAFEKLGVAALSAIPWVGGVISASAGLALGDSGTRVDSLHGRWLLEHREQLLRLFDALTEIGHRFETLGAEFDERIESDEYLTLVRQTFQAWDRASTEQKRTHLLNLITNAAWSDITSDEVLRLFIDWLDRYHENHLAVIGAIYAAGSRGVSARDIWGELADDVPRDDSANADLFRLVLRELSMGGVIRKARETTDAGAFKRKARAPRQGPASATLKSSFDDEDPRVLTQLGQQFVHYVMNDLVSQISPAPDDAARAN